MFASLSLIAVSSLFASSVLAVPAPGPPQINGCSLAKVAAPLPKNQTLLVNPTGQTLKFLAVGLGVQNYTCGAAGTFGSTGAVAQLFDASCFVDAGTPMDVLTKTGLALEKAHQLPQLNGNTPLKLGDHFFVENAAGTGIAPFFTFVSSQKNANAFILAAKTGDIPAPTDPKDNVDWLMLGNSQGSLAKTVFRLDTAGGQPAASCTTGQTASIPYSAIYMFYA